MRVLLDIGSTLVDGPNLGPARRLAEALELPAGAETRLSRLLFTTDPGGPEGLACAIATAFGVDPRRAEEVVGELWQTQIDEAYALPGAAAAVESLRRVGLEPALVSNIWPPFFEGFRKCLPELADSCPAYLSYRLGLAKPDPAIYRHALVDLAAEPFACVMIGDTYRNDIEPAQRLGLKTIWLLHRPAKERADLAAVLNGAARPPDLTLTAIAELRPEHVRRLLDVAE